MERFVRVMDAFADANAQTGWQSVLDTREEPATRQVINADGIVMDQEIDPVVDPLKKSYFHGQVRPIDVINHELTEDCAVTNAMLALMCHLLDHVCVWPRNIVSCIKRRAVGFYAHDMLTCSMRQLPSKEDCARIISGAADALQATECGRELNALFVTLITI